MGGIAGPGERACVRPAGPAPSASRSLALHHQPPARHPRPPAHRPRQDEEYIKQFGIEMYMFLAMCERTKALKAFEREQASCYDPGNELSPFLQFGRLVSRWRWASTRNAGLESCFAQLLDARARGTSGARAGIGQAGACAGSGQVAVGA